MRRKRRTKDPLLAAPPRAAGPARGVPTPRAPHAPQATHQAPIVSSCVHFPFVVMVEAFAENTFRERPATLRTQFRVIVALATAFAGIAVGYTPAVAADASTIRINEVESNGGTPGDWVELVNTGTDRRGRVRLGRQGQRRHPRVHDRRRHEHRRGRLPGRRRRPGVRARRRGLGATVRRRRYDAGRLLQLDGARRHHLRPVPGRQRRVRHDRLRRPAARRTTAAPRPPSREDQRGRVQRRHAGRLGRARQHRHRRRRRVRLGRQGQRRHPRASRSRPARSLAPGRATWRSTSTRSFGLGGADSARLFAADGTTLVDSYTWTAHAATTYGRCPDGTGAFATTTASTKGAANACAGQTPAAAWPGGAGVSHRRRSSTRSAAT